MTSNIIKEEIVKNEWNSVRLVRCNSTSSIILTDGDNSRDTFCGTVIFAGKDVTDTLGEYFGNWSKECFTPITSPITIEFNP